MNRSLPQSSCVVLRLASLLLLSVCFLAAQDWKTATSLPGTDFSKLTAPQQAIVLKILREHDCSCGCGMKLAECRMVDPNCSYSRGLASVVIDAIAHGKSEADAIAAADASHFAHIAPTALLEDPISIPIGGAPFTGPEHAPITVVEFSDFQCPYCAVAMVGLRDVLKAYPAKVKLVFKEFPLDIHSQAQLAAAAAVAAQKQGKFWPMHDAMFANRDDLSRDKIIELAKQNGLDLKRFQADWDSTEVREQIQRDVQDGEQAGVQGTPTIFINGQRYNGQVTLASLRPVLDTSFKAAPGPQTASTKR